MRQKISGHKLGRSKDERKALRRIMIAPLFDHERIRPTLAKVDAVRGDAERMITLAKRVTKAGDAQMVHARRLVAARLGNQKRLRNCLMILQRISEIFL